MKKKEKKYNCFQELLFFVGGMSTPVLSFALYFILKDNYKKEMTMLMEGAVFSLIATVVYIVIYLIDPSIGIDFWF